MQPRQMHIAYRVLASSTKQSLLATFLTILLCATFASKPAQSEIIYLENPDPTYRDYMGALNDASIILGDKVIVGAYGHDAGAGLGSGEVYVYDRQSGALLEIISNPTPAPSDFFGVHMHGSGDKLVIGAYNDFDLLTSTQFAQPGISSGAAYVYDLTSGELEKTFYGGSSAFISGNHLVTGSVNDGTVYLYDLTTAELVRSFSNPTPETYDLFGNSLAISGDKLFVGNSVSGLANVNQSGGEVVVFDINTGSIVRTLEPPSPADVYNFGYDISVSDQNLIVSQLQNTAGGTVHIFDVESGVLLRSFTSTSSTRDGFGYSVDSDGDLVAVSALHSNNGAGEVFIYSLTTGESVARIANPTPNPNDRFGSTVALSGSSLVVGALGISDIASDAGGAYLIPDIYNIEPTNGTPSAVPEISSDGAVAGFAAFLSLMLFLREALVRGVPNARKHSNNVARRTKYQEAFFFGFKPFFLSWTTFLQVGNEKIKSSRLTN